MSASRSFLSLSSAQSNGQLEAHLALESSKAVPRAERESCVFCRGRGFITVHLQLFAVVAGLLPVQLQPTIRPAERRGEEVKSSAH